MGGSSVELPKNGKRPFQPGEPYCHHCGESTPLGMPSSQDRCDYCGLHLRACRNCMFCTGPGCLLESPFRHPEGGLPGQDCPDFLWRDDELAPTLTYRDVRRAGE
jgi:hypothetical protein